MELSAEEDVVCRVRVCLVVFAKADGAAASAAGAGGGGVRDLLLPSPDWEELLLLRLRATDLVWLDFGAALRTLEGLIVLSRNHVRLERSFADLKNRGGLSSKRVSCDTVRHLLDLGKSPPQRTWIVVWVLEGCKSRF